MCAIRLISSYMRRDTGCVYTTFLNQTTKINHVKITILLFRIILRLDFRSGRGLAKQKKLHHITKNSMDIVHIAKNKCWWDIEGSDMFIPLLGHYGSIQRKIGATSIVCRTIACRMKECTRKTNCKLSKCLLFCQELQVRKKSCESRLRRSWKRHETCVMGWTII